MSRPSEKLFAEPQSDFFEKSYEEKVLEENSQTVECLGMTFPNVEERRKHFLDKLREKLKDREFRNIEGFPIGSDEDILALSDPPYYTACPNPFIADFIEHYGKPYDPSEPYSREPFAADVSEGKNDPIYNAHSYHTKVPHKAIMRYILHYTERGDVVFDGFCGTGMTGVAAQMCGDKIVVESLGYRVDKNGIISQHETDENGKEVWKPFSKIGARRAVLNDLSPAATFIAYNYNTPVDVNAFEREAKRILKVVEDECEWMYETLHTDGKTKGKINYTIWSDVFVCLDCTREVIFWEAAVDKEAGSVRDEFPCPHCGAMLTKRRMERAWVSKFDRAISQTIHSAKQVPVVINYTVGIARYDKKPDKVDCALIERIEQSDIPYWFPTDRMPEGDESRRNDDIGITHVHHFYRKRSLWTLACFLNKICTLTKQTLKARLIFVKTAAERITSILSSIAFSYFFHGGGGFINAGRKGTLYISSVVPEIPAYTSLTSRLSSVTWQMAKPCEPVISTQSSDHWQLIPNCLDYIFLDPPFGANIMYSELNFLWESWLRCLTNVDREALVNKAQSKGLDQYRDLMTACFIASYRLLKPGRWMTVEFSNTKASVWNTIQTALQDAGFVVANVSALDKKQGSIMAYTTSTAVKQDLIISAYKPNGGFEERFQKEAQTEEGVWDFVRTHLKYLPVIKRQGASLLLVPERDPRILFDQMIAFYVRKGYQVPISSQEFQVGLAQRFIERDGMYFLHEQAAEYDRKKMTSGGPVQAPLFVSDEASAIQWLHQLIKERPQTFSDINPQFMQQLGGWSKNETQLDLRELLNQNFLSYDGNGEVPSQIHSYLSTNFKELRNLPKDDERLRSKGKDRWYVPDPNKAGDLEKLRERSLLKEFEEYRTSSQKRLKVFRLEAVRAGFKKAWQDKSESGYRTIIEVAKKIPENVLQEDPKLLMWYDQAITRAGEE